MKKLISLFAFVGWLNALFAQNYIVINDPHGQDTVYYDTVRMTVYVIGLELQSIQKNGENVIYPSYVIPQSRLSSSYTISDYMNEYCGTFRTKDTDSVLFFINYCDYFRGEPCYPRFLFLTSHPYLRKPLTEFMKPATFFPVLKKNIKYTISKDNCHFFHVYIMDAVWLRFKLLSRGYQNVNGLNWIQPDIKQKYTSWYILNDITSFSPVKELRNQGLELSGD